MMTKAKYIFVPLVLLSVIACSKEKMTDFRDNLIGTYQGTESYQYYFLNAMDTSQTVSEQGSAPDYIEIGKPECEDCIAIVYDTVSFESGTIILADTIIMTDESSFENTYVKIGDVYYREYSVSFEDDSLHISYHWGRSNESYRYTFNGRKIP